MLHPGPAMSTRAARAALLVALALGIAGCGGDAGLPAPPDEVDSPVELASYRPRPEGTLTFNEQIGPVIYANCTHCHRPGEVAPFPFSSYEDVRKRASQIVTVITTGFMPPWLTEPGYNEFVGERRLSVDEIGMIRQWVKEGAPEGDPGKRPEPPSFTEGWQLGSPDLVVELQEPYTLRAGGGDVFRNFVIPDAVKEDRYVRAMEFRPRNPGVLHHAEFRIDRSEASRRLDARDPGPGYDGMDSEGAVMPDGHFLGWVPGKRPFEVADGMSWRLGADTDLVVQLHLLPSGKPERLEPRLGLYFTDRPPAVVPMVMRLGSRTMDIPAGERDYVISDAYTLPVDVEVRSVFPHAHYLAKDMKAWAVLPDGSKRWLLRIRDWDFNWQDDFRYVEPIVLPRGTVLAMRYSFDNSEDNPRNPHYPPERVMFGPSTYDEMADLWVQVVPRDESQRERLQSDFARYQNRRAIARYRLAVERDPQDPSAHNNLGHHYLSDGRPEDALAEFRRAVELDPGYAGARRNFAVTLYRMGRVEPALQEFEQVLKLEPDNAETHFTMGHMLFEQRQPGRAIPHYRKAVELRPEYPEAHFFLGSSLEATGDPDGALEHFLRTVELEPDWVVPLRSAAWLLATHPERARRDPDRAIALAAHAAELTRNRDPVALEALAAAQAAKGRMQEAIRTAETGLSAATDPRARPVALRLREQLERYRQGLAAVD